MQIKRGEIYLADLNPVAGSKRSGIVPVLIIQNDYGNKFSSTTIVAPISRQTNRPRLPTRAKFSGIFQGKHIPALAILDQPRTLDKSRLRECVGAVSTEMMEQINSALAVSFGLEHS